MAVLVEAISVVVKRASVNRLYPGGWDAFARQCPSSTLCADGHVARIGFMTPTDVRGYIDQLRSLGFTFNEDDSDIMVVDQLHGPTSRGGWLECGHINLGGHEVAACRLAGDTETALLTPEGWCYDDSLSERPGFAAAGELDSKFEFVRHENGVDVYRDKGRQAERSTWVGPSCREGR